MSAEALLGSLKTQQVDDLSDIRVDSTAAPTGTLTLANVVVNQTLNMGGRGIINVGMGDTPGPTNAATKAYVDAGSQLVNAIAAPYDEEADSPDMAALMSRLGDVIAGVGANEEVFETMGQTVANMEGALGDAHANYEAIRTSQQMVNIMNNPVDQGTIVANIDNADTLIGNLETLKTSLQASLAEVDALVQGGSLNVLVDNLFGSFIGTTRPMVIPNSHTFMTLGDLTSGLAHFDNLKVACDALLARAADPARGFTNSLLKKHISNVHAIEAAIQVHTTSDVYGDFVARGATAMVIVSPAEVTEFEVVCQQIMARFHSIQAAILLFATEMPVSIYEYTGQEIIDFSTLTNSEFNLMNKPASTEELVGSGPHVPANFSTWVAQLAAIDVGFAGVSLDG